MKQENLKKNGQEWEDVENKFYTFENEGDQIEGVLISKSINQKENGGLNIYTLQKDGLMQNIWGTSHLDQLFLNVKLNDYIRITLVEIKNLSAKKNFKRFRMEKKKVFKDE